MTHRIESGWNVARIGTHTLSVTGNLGTQSVSLTTGTVCHTDLTSVLGAGRYGSFRAALAAAMDASGASSTPFLIDWNSSTPLRYRLQTVAGFSLTFPNTDAGDRMADALGFARNSSTATLNGHTGTRRPYYVIDGIMGSRSNWTRPYEGDDVVTQSEAEDGSTYTTGRTTVPVYEDWSVPFEERAAVYEAEADSAVPWTWQHFFRQNRGIEPFGVFDDDGNTVHVLRGARGARFRPSRVQADWDGLFSIDLLTIQRGVLA